MYALRPQALRRRRGEQYPHKHEPSEAALPPQRSRSRLGKGLLVGGCVLVILVYARWSTGVPFLLSFSVLWLPAGRRQLAAAGP